MKKMEIRVTKLTDVDLLRKANSMTTGNQSKMSLNTCYKTMHSNMRTQLFYIELYDIPAFVCTHLVRHVHAQPFVRSKRTDRGGADFNDLCRNLAFHVSTCWITKDVNPDDPRTIARAIAECDEVSQKIERLPEQFDRLAPQSMSMLLSAEEIINISRVRLCTCASHETRDVWARVKDVIATVDPDLAKYMVRSCIFRGGICPELKCCGYNKSEAGQKELAEYREHFK
jgi:hypothetical protein